MGGLKKGFLGRFSLGGWARLLSRRDFSCEGPGEEEGARCVLKKSKFYRKTSFRHWLTKEIKLGMVERLNIFMRKR